MNRSRELVCLYILAFFAVTAAVISVIAYDSNWAYFALILPLGNILAIRAAHRRNDKQPE